MASEALKERTWEYITCYLNAIFRGFVLIAVLLIIADHLAYAGDNRKRKAFEALPFEHFVLYQPILPPRKVVATGSDAEFVSKYSVQNLPEDGLRLDWEETIECDLIINDGRSEFSYYAEVNPTGKRYLRETALRVSRWTANYRRHDGYTGADIPIKYPNRNSNCRLN